MVKTTAWWVTVGALFLVLLTPLIVVNSLFFPFITGKAFYFRILVEVASMGYLVLAAADKKYRPRWSWLLGIFLLFVAWTFIADLLAVNPAKALWSNFERMEGWVTVIHLFLLYIVASAVLTADNLWVRWWKSSLGVSFLVGIYGLFQLMGLAVIHQGGARLDATFGNATYLAIYFLMHIFVMGWLMAREKGWQRYAYGALAVFEAILLVFTATRGAVLGLVAGAFVAAVLAAVVSSARARKMALGGVVVVLILVGGFMLVKNESWIQNDPTLGRISSISLSEGQVRFEIWGIAWKGFLERPITGWGEEGFNYVFNQYYNPALYAQEPWFDRAHNEFIDWLVAGGLPAFLLYIGLFISAFWLLWRRPDFTNAERIGFTALLVGYGVNNLFVFDNLMSYVLFAAVLAYIHGRVATPVTRIDAWPEVSPEKTSRVVIPIAVVLGLVVIYFVNVPAIRAASDLIEAISPQPSMTATIAAFDQAIHDGSFADQEIREQMVSVASSAVSAQSLSDADKTAIVTEAVEQMQTQVNELPMDARLRLELALAYSLGSDYTDSLKQLLVARQLSPDKEAIIVEEGETFWQSGDSADAKADFDAAYALGPSFDDLAIYKAVGDFITNDAATGKALLLSRFGTTTVDNNVLMLAYYKLGDWDDLIAIWNKRVADDNSADNYFGLAAADAAAGRKDAAIAAVTAAVRAHPEAEQEGAAFLQELSTLPS